MENYKEDLRGASPVNTTNSASVSNPAIIQSSAIAQLCEEELHLATLSAEIECAQDPSKLSTYTNLPYTHRQYRFTS